MLVEQGADAAGAEGHEPVVVEVVVAAVIGTVEDVVDDVTTEIALRRAGLRAVERDHHGHPGAAVADGRPRGLVVGVSGQVVEQQERHGDHRRRDRDPQAPPIGRCGVVVLHGSPPRRTGRR